MTRSSTPTEDPPPQPRRGGPGWLVAVVFGALGLGGGFALHMLVPPHLLPEYARAPKGARTDAMQPGGRAGATAAPVAMAPPMRAVVERPRSRPRPVKPGPSLQELTRRAEAKNLARLDGLAVAALAKIGVQPVDLPALPKIAEAYRPVGAAVRKRDFEGAMNALFALRGVLAERRNECKKVRRRKFKWARKAVRAIRKAAPRKRAERKRFLEEHKWKDLRDQLKILKKRSRDRKLTCAEKSLAYKDFIGDLQQTLAKVAPKKPTGDDKKAGGDR